MQAEIAGLDQHYIVCGAGRTGSYIIRDLRNTRRPFVVIDQDEEVLRELTSGGYLLSICGNATEEHVLASAGLDRAAGLLAALPEDKDNLFLVLTARHLRPDIRIIARGTDISAEEKMKRAGADSVVYPNRRGGRRMVSEMMRPAVVGFLDQMLRPRHSVRFEEVVIPDGSHLCGRSIADSGIRQKTGLLIVGCKEPGQPFVYNPPATTVLTPRMALVVLAEPQEVAFLKALADRDLLVASRG